MVLSPIWGWFYTHDHRYVLCKELHQNPKITLVLRLILPYVAKKNQPNGSFEQSPSEHIRFRTIRISWRPQRIPQFAMSMVVQKWHFVAGLFGLYSCFLIFVVLFPFRHAKIPSAQRCGRLADDSTTLKSNVLHGSLVGKKVNIKQSLKTVAVGQSMKMAWQTSLCTSWEPAGGGGGIAVAGIGKKCGKKCDRKWGSVRMVFAPRNPYVSSRLAQLGAQSMDGSMEPLSAVVQLKNITD